MENNQPTFSREAIKQRLETAKKAGKQQTPSNPLINIVQKHSYDKQQEASEDTTKPTTQAQTPFKTTRDGLYDRFTDRVQNPVVKPDTKSLANNPLVQKPQAQPKQTVDKPWYEDVIDGFQSAGRSALSAIGTGAGEVTDFLGTVGTPGGIGRYNMVQQLKSKGVDIGAGKGMRDYAEGQAKKAEKINEQADTESIGHFVGSVIPYTIGTALAVATAPVSVPASATIGATSLGGLALASFGSGVQAYDQYKDEKGMEKDPYARLGIGLLYGGAEFAMERISLNKFLPKEFKGKVGKMVFGSIPPEALEKTSKELVEQFAKSSKSRGEMIKNLAKNAGEGMFVEGSTEAATEVAQEFTNWLYLEKEDRSGFKEILENSAKAFAGGALMGGALGPLSYGSQSIVNNQRRKDANRVVLAQNTKTGETLEIVGQTQGKGDKKTTNKTTASGEVSTETREILYDAIRPNGKIIQVTESEIGEVIDLPYDTFSNLLNGKIDGQAAIEQRTNQDLLTEAESQQQKLAAQYEPFILTDPLGNRSIAQGKHNGEDVFVTGIDPSNPNNLIITDLQGNKRMVQKDHVSEIIQTPYDEFMAQNSPVTPDTVAPFDPANPVQTGETINYEGENWVVTGVDTESGTVQLESLDEDGAFETLPLDVFQQIRKPTEQNIQEETTPTEETGAGKLRSLFGAGEEVTLQKDPVTPEETKIIKPSPEDARQYDGIVKDIAEKLGIEKFDAKPIGLQGELRAAHIKDWLTKNGGEIGQELAEIIEFPRAVRRLIDSLPQPQQNESDSKQEPPASADSAGAQQPSAENVQPEPTDQGTDGEVQVREDLTEYEQIGLDFIQKGKIDQFRNWIKNQGLLGGFNGIRDIANNAGIKYPQSQKEFDKEVGGAKMDEFHDSLMPQFIEYFNSLLNNQEFNENQQTKPPAETGQPSAETSETGNQQAVNDVEAQRDEQEPQEGQVTYPDVETASTADELARLYNTEVNNPEGVTPVENAISQVIEPKGVDQASFIRHNDKKNISQGTALGWFKKSEGGQGIDQIAQEASMILYPNGDGTEITTEDVTEYMLKFSNNAETTTPKGNPKLKAINDKYKAITGKNLNRAIAKKMAQKSLMGKPDSKGLPSELLDTDEKIANFIENNPDVNFFLQDELMGFVVDGVPQYQAMLDAVDSDPGMFTSFPGNLPEDKLPVLKQYLQTKLQENDSNQGADQEIQGTTEARGGDSPVADQPGQEEGTPADGPTATGDQGQAGNSPAADPKGKSEPDGGKGASSDTPVRVVAKEEKIANELKDLWNQFGKAGKGTLNSGVSAEQFVIAGKIIAKAAELGLVKFEQTINWVKDNMGMDVLAANFNSFKAAYVANLAVNNPNREDLNSIASQNIDQYKEEPNKAVEQEDNQNNEQRKQQQEPDIEAIESKVKAIERKSKSIKNRKQAAGQLSLLDDVLTDIESELELAGYYEAPESESDATENPHKAHEKYFKKDLVKFSKELASELGWEHDTDKKGKKIYADTNVAPAGGDGLIILWKPDSEYGVYISVPVQDQSYTGKEGLKIQGSGGMGMFSSNGGDGAILWRITTKKNKYTGLSNNFADSKTTVGQFKKLISKEVNKHDSPKITNLSDILDPKPKEKDHGTERQGLQGVDSPRVGATPGAEQSPTPPVNEVIEQPEPVSSGQGERSPGTDKTADRPGNDGPRGKGDGVGGSDAGSTAKRIKKVVQNKDNFRIPEDFHTPDTFSVPKNFDANIEALELLSQMMEEGRTIATAEEKQVLFGYVGFGGLKEILYDPKYPYQWGNSDAIRKRVQKIHDIVSKIDPDGSKKIMDSIKASTANAHFTNPDLIRGIYDVVKEIGFTGGNVLEPSMGIGHFLGAMPDSITKNSSLTGVELDYLTAEIARRLYPNARIINSGLQNAVIPENSQDLVISNIPFGDIKIFDPTWKSKRGPVYKTAQSRVHNYFVVKAIETARPGGLVVIITSKSSMDTKGNSAIRQYMKENAKFIGAVRLPDNAFKGNAGTEVVTDIIFMQKFKPGEEVTQNHQFTLTKPIELDGKEYFYNEYFHDNPEQIIGELAVGGLYNREDITVKSDLTKLRGEIIERMKTAAKNANFSPITEIQSVQERIISEYKGADKVKVGNVVFENGDFSKVISNEDGIKTESVKIPGKFIEPLQSFIGIRNVFNELITNELLGESDDVLNPIRKNLKKSYDEFIKTHGRLNDYRKVFENDIDSFNILGLEKLNEDGDVIGLADIFDKRTIKPYIRPDKADSPQDALFISVNEYGMINPKRMQELLGEDWVEQSAGLVFKLPDGSFETREQYLSGNIAQKIDQVEGLPEFKTNLEELKKVLPSPIPIEHITIPLGARYVNEQYYNEFLSDLTGNDVSVKYIPGTDEYRVVNDQIYSSDYATSKMTAKELIEAVFKDKTIRIFDTFKNPDGSTYRVFNSSATVEAVQIANRISQKWSEWLLSKKEYADDVAATYNRLFNSTVNRTYDGSFLTFSGLKGVELRQHQKDAVYRIVQNNGGIIDHVVGAGKTYVMVAAAMELKRVGIAKKPLIIGTKSTIPHILRDFKEAYPNAKVLSPSEKDFTASNRKKMLSQIAINDWDAVILTHENFEAIEVDPDSSEKVIQNEISLLEMSIEELKGDRSQMSRRTLKGLEKRKENLSVKIQQLRSVSKDREIMHFGQLGIDHIMVDESQTYKNLAYSTTHDNVAGLGSKEGSKRSFNLLMATRFLQTMHKGDKGITFLSGTPIKNSMVEMYLLLKYLRPSKLSEVGLETFDAWAKTFAEKSSEMEFGVSGQVKQKERFRRFVNVPELAQLYTEIADVRDDSNLKLPKPKPKGGSAEFVLIKPSPSMELFSKKLIEFVRTDDASFLGIDGFDYDKDENNAKMLQVTDLATKAAIDLRLLYPDAPYDPNSKIGIVAANVAKSYKESTPHKGTHLIFMDKGKSSKFNPGFNGEQEIKRILVEEYGIPAKEIRTVAGLGDKARADLFKKVNEGEVRILIGGTQTLGTGVNAQKRIVSMHHVDIPWEPASYEQRNGRGLRQGNVIAKKFYNNEVDIKVYGVERSLDAYKFELLSIKQGFITQIKSGSTEKRVLDEGSGDEETGMGFSDFMAMATGNPIIKEKAKNDKEIEQLLAGKKAYVNRISTARHNIEKARNAILNSEKVIAQYKKYQNIANENGVLDDYAITVDGKSFETITEAGEAIKKVKPYTEEQFRAMQNGGTPIKPHAEANGFNMYIFESQDITGNKLRKFALSVRDKTGMTLYPVVDILSSSPVYTANSIKNYVKDIDKKIQDNENSIHFQQKKLADNEKILTERWDKESELDAALLEQKRIADEIEEMNKQEDARESDDDLRQPLFGSPRLMITGLKDILDPKLTQTKPGKKSPKSSKIQQVVDKITANWKNGPKITVYPDGKSILKAFPNMDLYDMSKVPGFYFQGQVVINASHHYHQDPKKTESVILHEAIGHFGVHGLIEQIAAGRKIDVDKVYQDMMEEVFANKWDTELMRYISRMYFGKPVEELAIDEMRIAAEEYIAHVAQTGVKDSIMDRVITMFRKLFRSLGFDMKMSDSEIRTIIGNSYRFVMNSPTPTVRPGVDLKSVPSNMIIGEKGADQLDYREQVTRRLDNLRIAREMEAADKDTKSIRMATGWERGADGKWRYEIPDGEVKEIGRRYVSLNEILDNKDLFKAYPHLEEIGVTFDINKNNNNTGSYTPYENREDQGLFDIQEEINVIATDLENGKSILLHEVQHAIQFKEGFATGGSPMSSSDDDVYIKIDLNNVERLIRDAMKKKQSGEWVYESSTLSEIIDSDQDHSQNVKQWAKNVVEKGDKEIDLFLKETPMGRYKRLSGEVEARNVQTRTSLSEEQRRSTLLSETEDVAREDQIFLNSAGPQMSIQDQTETPAFKEWFGDSKVVDENGKPLVVYHGTNAEFTTFDKAKLGTNTGWDNTKFGFFFIADKQMAQDFAVENGGGTIVMEVFLSIKNPIDLNMESIFTNKKQSPTIVEILTGERLSEDEAIEWINEEVDIASLLDVMDELVSDNGKDIIIRDGFDGMISHFGAGHKEYIAFEPTQIKSATGNNGQFSNTNPDIRYLIVDTPQVQTERLQKAHSAASERWTNMVEKYQNNMVRAKNLIESKLGGKKVKDSADFYTKENLSKGKTLVQTEAFMKDFYDPMIATGKKMNRQFKVSMEEIGDYLYALHAPERNAFIKEQNPKIKFDPSGMSDDEAANIVADFESKVPQDLRDELKAQVAAINEFVNSKRLESGLISEEVYEQLTNQYENYVPLRGWEDLMSEDMTVYSPLISAKGRKSKAGNPIPYLVTAAQEAVMKGENNKVRQSVLEFVKGNVSPGEYQIRNAWYRKTGEQDGAGNDIWEETTTRPPKSEIDAGNAIRSFNPSIHKAVKMGGRGENILPVMVNGRKVFIEFKDARIPMSIKNMNQEKVPALIAKLRAYTRWLSSMYTQYSPEFGLRNLIRDVGFGTFNILAEDGFMDGARTAKEMGTSMKTLFNHFWTGEYTDTKDGKMLKEFMDAGALTGYSDLKNAGDVFKSAQNEINRLNQSGWWNGTKNITQAGLEKALKPIDVYNRTFENAMRFSYYKMLRNKGVSEQQAAIRAKDLTVNFNRKGNSSSLIGSIYLFFNASVQGNERLLRNFFNPKTRKKAFGMMGTLVATGMIQSIMYGMMDDEDDDGMTFYDKIPDYVRRTNIIVPVPGEGEYIKIPLPYGINVFYSMGESLGRVITGRGDAGKEALGVVTSMSDSFSPIGGFDFEGDDLNIFQKMLHFATPSAVQPITDLAFNRNFAGSPIYKEPFTSNSFEFPDSQNYFKNVNPAIRSLTDLLNSATGGDEVQPGAIDINPEWIEHGIEQYFGGPVQFAKNVSGTVAVMLQGENIAEDPHYRKIPFVRNYLQKSGGQYQTQEQYYENARHLNRIYSTFKEYADMGNEQKVNEFHRQHRKELEMYEVGKNFDKSVKKINKAISSLYDVDTQEAKNQMEQLYEERAKVMKEYNKLYNQKIRTHKEIKSLDDIFK